jgi:hypothetical protein
MKPGDLVQFSRASHRSEKDSTVIMTVLAVFPAPGSEWEFPAPGEVPHSLVDVFYPTGGVRTYSINSLDIISSDHTLPGHAILTALSFAGSCASGEGGCNE